MSFVRSSVLVDFLDFARPCALNIVITVAIGLNSLYCGYNCHFLNCIFLMKVDDVRPVAVSSM